MVDTLPSEVSAKMLPSQVSVPLVNELALFGHPLRRDFHPISRLKAAHSRSIQDIDTFLVAPYNGFGSGMRGCANYYRAQRVHIQNMQTCPVLMLHASDDPIANQECYLQCCTFNYLKNAKMC